MNRSGEIRRESQRDKDEERVVGVCFFNLFFEFSFVIWGEHGKHVFTLIIMKVNLKFTNLATEHVLT